MLSESGSGNNRLGIKADGNAQCMDEKLSLLFAMHLNFCPV
jgi:hypothetical protein